MTVAVRRPATSASSANNKQLKTPGQDNAGSFHHLHLSETAHNKKTTENITTNY